MLHLASSGVSPCQLMSVIAAAALLDGTLLDQLAANNGEVLKESSMVSDLVPPSVCLSFCSVCSGGEVVLCVLRSLRNFYGSIGILVKFLHVF